jgi:hypothetical protein
VAELDDGGERTGRALSLTSDYHVPVDGSTAPDLDSVLPYWYEEIQAIVTSSVWIRVGGKGQRRM